MFFYPEKENRLHAWIKSVRSVGGCLDRRAIQAKAISLMDAPNESSQRRVVG
jgi:hypothetical protein